jgi:cytoskeletal protein RodZ
MKKDNCLAKKIHFLLIAIIVIMFFGSAAICNLCSAPTSQTTITDTPAEADTSQHDSTNTAASAGSTSNDTDNDTSSTTAAGSTEETESAAETSTQVTDAPNNPPKIMEFFITEGVIFNSTINDAWVNALDEDGDTISYEWIISAGSINNVNESRTKWQAPGTSGTLTLTVKISDGKGGTDEASTHINIVESAPAEVLISLNPDNTNSGYISYGNDADPDNVYKGATLLVGDDNLNNMCKGYASFTLPETLFNPSTNITKVELIISDILFSGNPESFASELHIKQHDFGNLELADFLDQNGTLIGKFPTAGLKSNPQISISGDVMINTLRKVIEAGRTSYQIKLGLNNDTDGDGSSDSMVFHGANISLSITIN